MGLETGTVTPQVTVGRQCHVGSIDLVQAELPPPHVKEDACLVELHEHTPSDEKSSRSWRAEYMTAAAFVAVTLASYPYTGGIRSWHYVWWCGWLTAVSTGVGALPFLWVKDIDKFWLGVCNGTRIGVGVSFGGDGGDRRGLMVSLTLAIHNIPEGLAVRRLMTPLGLNLLPQPIFAVPSFLFVETFLPILPCGLGFAGGAMAYVAICELLPESVEDTENKLATAVSLVLAFVSMLNIQYVLTGEL
ncbi:hypothetical protein B5M09_002436 [Aphanomyces astaci]|uniref:Uncharacterized protein n=1 Tax=Aphanomyces astaci TaxID=112090 RepID=A0A3R7WY16_APHAT|nr:hypothetical protein B5M09_002436 [Aphanomyces astaci]